MIGKMTLYAKCKVCGMRIELPLTVVYEEGGRILPSEYQKRKLLKMIIEHIKKEHPKEYAKDKELQRIERTL